MSDMHLDSQTTQSISLHDKDYDPYVNQVLDAHIGLDDFQEVRDIIERYITTVETEYASASSILQDFSQVDKHDYLPALQIGATCGCYATGMAIESLIEEREKAAFKSTKRNYAEKIAEAFEEMVKLLGMSSVGEMFSADTLAAAVNEFSQRHIHDRILASVADFDSVEQLYRIIKMATLKGVRVLVAYYAGGKSIFPTVPIPDKDASSDEDGKIRVKPEFMSHAHWATVNAIGDGPGDVQVDLYEGHKKLNGIVQKIDALYDSNNSLGDSFRWESYFKECRRSMDEYIEKVLTYCSEQMKQPEPDVIKITQVVEHNLAIIEERRLKIEQEKDAVRQRSVLPKAPFTTHSEDGPIEDVDLRGKLVLIGIKANPSPTA